MATIFLWIKNNKITISAMLGMLLMGIIDQRRGSATGSVQMTFSYAIGIATFIMALPFGEYHGANKKKYLVIDLLLIIVAVIAGIAVVPTSVYAGKTITIIISLSLWGIILVNEIINYGHEVISRIYSAPLLLMVIMLAFHAVSNNDSFLGIYYLVVFGGLAIVVDRGRMDKFMEGILLGIVLWFIFQQAVCYGFRPYDYVGYRGLYSGETQSGIHYMIVYSALLLLAYMMRKSEKKVYVRICLIFASIVVCFTLLTIRKGALLAEIVITFIVLIKWAKEENNTFRSLVFRGIYIVVFIIVMYVPVYASVRFFPCILHHPIWFEGEYSEDSTVRSFDPWDSDRYISLKEITDITVMRYLDVVRATDKQELVDNQGENDAEAEVIPLPEGVEYYFPEKYYTFDPAREAIWRYYLSNLNLFGHRENEGRFVWGHEGDAFSPEEIFGNAHNMFIEVAYKYGIPCGILYLLVWILTLIKGWKQSRTSETEFLRLVLLIAILCIGMIENVITIGAITLSLIGVLLSTIPNERLKIEKH